MTKKLEELFKSVKNGDLEVKEALKQAKFSFYHELKDFAKIDSYHTLRKGLSEVVYCEGKETKHATNIIIKMAEFNDQVLATRARKEIYELVKQKIKRKDIIYHQIPQIIEIGKPTTKRGLITIITGGTSDYPIAEEAYITANALGNNTQKIYDIGIAGLQRLISNLEKISKSNIVIAIAGMEGALPTVLAGLIDKPVIGVPTSKGPKTFDGLVPLFSMLNSCTGYIAVMNIDNGFGAAYFASLINKLCEQNKS